jgi:hypothetical protein
MLSIRIQPRWESIEKGYRKDCKNEEERLMHEDAGLIPDF